MAQAEDIALSREVNTIATANCITTEAQRPQRTATAKAFAVAVLCGLCASVVMQFAVAMVFTSRDRAMSSACAMAPQPGFRKALADGPRSCSPTQGGSSFNPTRGVLMIRRLA